MLFVDKIERTTRVDLTNIAQHGITQKHRIGIYYYFDTVRYRTRS